MSEYFVYQMNKTVQNNAFDYFEKKAKTFNPHNARDQKRALDLFKDEIGASINYALKEKSCCIDDNFLFRFLFAKKFIVEDSLHLLINYFLHKQQNSALLQKLNIFDENIQLALRDGNPGVLRQRDRRGRKVITFQACNWDTNRYSMVDVYRAFLLTLDKLLENMKNQMLGFVVIVDWTNFSYRQSTHLSPKILKLMIEGLQDCMPIKFKGIHFISQPWYVDLALTVIKPFFTDKIKERIIIHGTNLSTLHAVVSKDILPPDLGGEGPSTNNLDWYHYLLESSQATQTTRMSYRLIEAPNYSKAPPTPLRSNSINKCETNFQDIVNLSDKNIVIQNQQS